MHPAAERLRPFRTTGSRWQDASSARVARDPETYTRRQQMIKVSVMYPNTPDARFDHDYYRDTHLPLIKSRLGDHLKRYTIDKGLAGGAPGAPATYVAMCHLYCDSVESFQSSFAPHAQEILGDIPNYTDLAPVLQISEVVVG
jgi:uncharacterized protein (TIGR02118 family)